MQVSLPVFQLCSTVSFTFKSKWILNWSETLRSVHVYCFWLNFTSLFYPNWANRRSNFTEFLSACLKYQLIKSVWNGSTLHFEMLVRESVKQHWVWPCSQAAWPLSLHVWSFYCEGALRGLPRTDWSCTGVQHLRGGGLCGFQFGPAPPLQAAVCLVLLSNTILMCFSVLYVSERRSSSGGLSDLALLWPTYAKSTCEASSISKHYSPRGSGGSEPRPGKS